MTKGNNWTLPSWPALKAALKARALDPALPLMKALGYREFAAYLSGEIDRDQALTAAQQRTRNYAKRQSTWMRGQMTDWMRITATASEGQWRQFLALWPTLTA